jgi:hypothetical protein
LPARRRVSGRISGTSPYSTSTRFVGDLRHRLRDRMAGAELACLLVPAQVGLGGERRPHLLAAVAVDDVQRGRARARAASITCASIGCPATGCSTLGRADFIRLPSPAARMTTCRGRSSGRCLVFQ